MEISMKKCKFRLATLWFSASGFLFFIMLFQTIFGRYGSHANEAWGWLLPTILPTLSLIISVFVIDYSGKGHEIRNVDSFIFKLTFILSSVYLIVVALTIFSQPFSSVMPLELMKQSNLWLGPFQGLVSASIGIFFFKKGKT